MGARCLALAMALAWPVRAGAEAPKKGGEATTQPAKPPPGPAAKKVVLDVEDPAIAREIQPPPPPKPVDQDDQAVIEDLDLLLLLDLLSDFDLLDEAGDEPDHQPDGGATL
jgi:hypothetical protein